MVKTLPPTCGIIKQQQPQQQKQKHNCNNNNRFAIIINK